MQYFIKLSATLSQLAKCLPTPLFFTYPSEGIHAFLQIEEIEINPSFIANMIFYITPAIPPIQDKIIC